MYYPFVRAYVRTLQQQDAENAKSEESDVMSPEPSQA